MTYKQLLALANQKAVEAQAILEGEDPDAEKANELLAQAEGYRARAEAVQKAQTLVSATEAEDEPEPEAKRTPITITEDESDKALKAKPFKTVGEFLQAVYEGHDRRLRPLRSESGYDVTAALPGFADSLYAARERAEQRKAAKAISGMSETVPADGGLLVQTDVRMNIMDRMYNVGNLLQRVSMIPISANANGLTLYGVDETSRVAGSRRGGVRGYWASEGDEKTSSKPKFREINLRLNKLVGLVYATDELLADASALGAYVQQVLPEELRFLAEDAIINGTGAGQPLGVLNSPSLVSVAKETGQAADTVVAENIIKMWSRRWAGNNDYIWLVNQDVTPQLHQLNLPVGTGGALVYMPPGGLSQSAYGSLYGRPVIETEYNATVGDLGDIILFSPSAYQMIDKGGIQSASSIHVRFIYDETVFRFVYRVDGQPLWHQPLTPYKGSNTQSPFVALAARA